MTEQETTAAAVVNIAEQLSLDGAGKENGPKAVASATAEVEQGGDVEKSVTADIPAATKGKDKIPIVESSPAAGDAAVEGNQVAEEPAATSNGNGVPTADVPAVPPSASDDVTASIPEPTAATMEAEAAAAASKPATDEKPEGAPDSVPAPVLAADAEEPKPEAAEAKASGRPQQPETAPDEEAEPQAKQQQEQAPEERPAEDEAPKPEAEAASEALPVKESVKAPTEEAKVDAAAGPVERLANGDSAPVDAGAATPANDASLVTEPGIVQALTRRLSSNSLQGQPGQQQPTTPPSGEASPPSAHDTKNTINISQLLKLGAFKKQPLKDFVPFAELQRLRVEDGIDATRKEDYLNDDDFKEAFGMDRESFKKQPAWRQVQAKKKANLF